MTKAWTNAGKTAAIFFAVLPHAVEAAPAPARGADVAEGARQFIQCRSCHTVTRGGDDLVGPNLWGVFGRKAAARPGFDYSSALSSSAMVWTAKDLDQYLERPSARVPGTIMVFQGIGDSRKRAALIAYLATLK